MQPIDASQTLQRDLKDIVRHAPGRLSIQVVGPAGVVAGWDSDREVPAASLVKVLVLVATLREVEAGRLSLDQTLEIPAARVGGAGGARPPPAGGRAVGGACRRWPSCRWSSCCASW